MSLPNAPTAINQPNIPAGQPQQIQLHDIHLPEQVSNFPIAPGWWILLAFIVLSAFWAYKKYREKVLINASKKKALSLLAANEDFSAKDSIGLLKWAAMQYFSRDQLAKLYGKQFQQFLTQQLPEKHQARFNELTSAGFAHQYQHSSADNENDITINLDCYAGAKLWLNYALPRDKKLQNKKLSVIEEKELSA